MEADGDNERGVDGAIVEMNDVGFRWPGRNAFALEIEHFSLASGERVLMVGPSGSGKSTFLSLLCGITAPQTGSIVVLGTDLAAQTASFRDRFRAEHIGVIFQMFNLLPYGSVLDNILLPLSFARARSQRVGDGGSAAGEAQRLLRALGLEDDVYSKSTHALSVGQQQRVAAARALIGAPELIVADEPTSALDRDRQELFLDLLFGQVDEAETSLLMVSHDETLAPRFDRVCRLEDLLQVEHAA